MSADLAVIFDVDGVLVDSYKAHHESWQLLCRERGFAMTTQQFLDTFGRTSREIIRELWGDRVPTDRGVAQVDERKEALYREVLRADFPAMDGAVELIDALSAAGFRLAVGSSGPPPNVALTLECLGRRDSFQAVITGADVTRGKPDPQVFLLAAERLGIAPSRCTVVEDAPVGVAAAHAAGMKCIAVAGTGRIREGLQKAEQIVNSLRELTADDFRRLHGAA